MRGYPVKRGFHFFHLKHGRPDKNKKNRIITAICRQFLKDTLELYRYCRRRGVHGIIHFDIMFEMWLDGRSRFRRNFREQ